MEHEILTLEILVENAGPDGCLGHIPALPGLCFRAETAEDVESLALVRTCEYVDWLGENGLGDLTPEAEALTRRVRSGDLAGVRVVETEHVAGAPVWESGNPAVLFAHDRRSLDDDAVVAHLRFVRRVLDRMRELVGPLSPEQLAGRPKPDRRSIDETLEHIGNCVWWYCSRIDDELPEPNEPAAESPLDRIDQLFDAAEACLLGIPLDARATVHIPQRFPTSDPHERWTHAKVCRRQAEHVWAHLPNLKTAVRGMTPVG